MSSDPLTQHVEHLNAAIRSGDFGPMLAAFATDAEMHFEGVPVGPYLGREAIAAAYAERPPDDEVRLLSPPRHDGDTLVADYAWAADGQRAGRMLLTVSGGLIQRLVVTFD
jgi:steroid Delta-isomerase